jgi:hypothetical protein
VAPVARQPRRRGLVSAATDRVARLPWVTRLEKTQSCDGYRWSHMPLKALYKMGDKPPVPGLKEKYRCKNRARWKFRALRNSSAKSGVYCWSHLISCGLRGDMAEDARTTKALEEMVIDEQLS